MPIEEKSDAVDEQSGQAEVEKAEAESGKNADVEKLEPRKHVPFAEANASANAQRKAGVERNQRLEKALEKARQKFEADEAKAAKK